MRARSVLAAVIALGALGVSDAGASYTIGWSHNHVTRVGRFRPAHPSLSNAIAAFGQPSGRRADGYGGCTVTWRRLRLKVTTANYGGIPSGHTTCEGAYGLVQTMTAKSRGFRTYRGLRVGARSSSVLAHHPSAEFHHGSYWLVHYYSPIGEGGEAVVVRAGVSGGRVRSFKLLIGGAGE